MEQPEEKSPPPKKSCMITLMFGIEADTEALELKAVIDEAVKGIKEKRYSFSINEK